MSLQETAIKLGHLGREFPWWVLSLKMYGGVILMLNFNEDPEFQEDSQLSPNCQSGAQSLCDACQPFIPDPWDHFVFFSEQELAFSWFLG